MASLILGILSLFLWLLTSIAAIITGHMALSRIKKSNGQLTGRGLAIAGLVLGYITTVLGGVVAVIVAATAIFTLKATDSLNDHANEKPCKTGIFRVSRKWSIADSNR